MNDPNPPSLLRQIGIQIAGGIIAGIVALTGVALMLGSFQTRLDRAITDIERLTTRMYTQRDALLELGPLYTRLDTLEQRIIRLESLPYWQRQRQPK